MTCDSDSELRSVPLGQIAQIERGKFSARPRNDPKYFGGSVPFIQTGDVRNSNGRMTDYSQTLNSQGLKVSRLFPAGTLFMTIAANIGDLGVAEFATACPDSLVALSPRAGVDQRWLFHALSMMKPTLVAIATQNAQANLNLEKLNSLALNVPPHASQVSIANILDDADSMIIKLQRLIAKKQAIKQGMMQQLLTGRTRLPGFCGEWTETRLGDHVTYVKTVALSRAQLDSSSALRYLHYGDIHTRGDVRLDASKEPMPRVSAELANRAGRLQVGDLVFADASEDPEGVGKSVEIAGVPSDGVVPGLHTIAARFDKDVLSDGFKAYLQHIPTFREQLLRLAAGTKVLATTRTYISSVTLALPDVNEQHAIAQVLDDCEAELEALRARLDKARNIKTGMMQQLLTGRVRLPVDTES